MSKSQRSSGESARRLFGSYSELADEYYDSKRHPTCRNFRDASMSYISKQLDKLLMADSFARRVAVDVGAGRSVLAEYMYSKGIDVDCLILVDESVGMLSNSKSFLSMGASLVVGSARDLPLASASVGLMVVSLGDPFNQPEFWFESARCLSEGAVIVFTAPSYKWASSFRGSSSLEVEGAAYFELGGGTAIYVPSYVYSESGQVDMAGRAGLELIDMSHIEVSQIPKPHSSKLLGQVQVVTGFSFVKQKVRANRGL